MFHQKCKKKTCKYCISKRRHVLMKFLGYPTGKYIFLKKAFLNMRNWLDLYRKKYIRYITDGAGCVVRDVVPFFSPFIQISKMSSFLFFFFFWVQKQTINEELKIHLNTYIVKKIIFIDKCVHVRVQMGPKVVKQTIYRTKFLYTSFFIVSRARTL